MTAADLTVVVVSFASRETIRACLLSLQAQTTGGFHTLVADSSSDGTDALVRCEFPQVTLLRSERRLYPGDARNWALQQANTPLIAFLDADCVAARDWVARILAAHAQAEHSDVLIIGGSVGVANPESKAGWALYFSEFSAWMPIGPSRRLRDIPTCCLSFKREAFERFGPFLEGSYCSDTLFNWKASTAGQPPLFIPEMHVRHHNLRNMGEVVAKLRMHGRSFASVRARHWAWRRSTSLLRAMTWFLLPGWLWLRTAFRVAGARELRYRFVVATPQLWIALVSWAWGEATGYWEAATKRI